MCPGEETRREDSLHAGDELSHRFRSEEAPTPASWARRLRQGDPAAVLEVRHRVRKILAYGPLSIPEQERADLEQEVMTDVWKAMNRPDFDLTAGFWGFIEVVTSRRCIDWLRAKKETVSILPDFPAQAASPFQTTLKSEREALASNVLSGLEPACREVITLRFQESLTYSEMADVLGKSEGALRVQVYRCIRHARKVMDKILEDGDRS